MPRIRCHYIDCVFLDEGFCSAAAVEIDPDSGCLTYSPASGNISNDDWETDDELEEWDDIAEDGEEDGDELWLDDDEDY